MSSERQARRQLVGQIAAALATFVLLWAGLAVVIPALFSFHREAAPYILALAGWSIVVGAGVWEAWHGRWGKLFWTMEGETRLRMAVLVVLFVPTAGLIFGAVAELGAELRVAGGTGLAGGLAASVAFHLWGRRRAKALAASPEPH